MRHPRACLGEVERIREGIPEGRRNMIEDAEVGTGITLLGVRKCELKMFAHQQTFLSVRDQGIHKF